MNSIFNYQLIVLSITELSYNSPLIVLSIITITSEYNIMITSVMMVNSIVITTVNMLLLLSISVFIIIITGSISIVTNHWIMSCRCQVTNDYLVSYWPLIPNLISILTNHCHSPWSLAIIVWLFGSNNM